MGVRLRLDHGKVVRVVGGMSRDAAQRAANRMQDRARVNIASAPRVDTGEMMREIHVRPLPSPPMRPTFKVSATTKQAVFNEWGTRDHGPSHAKVMVFRGRSGGIVFAKRVRGITAIHFMAQAKALASPFDFAL